jgi:hypothetical protein
MAFRYSRALQIPAFATRRAERWLLHASQQQPHELGGIKRLSIVARIARKEPKSCGVLRLGDQRLSGVARIARNKEPKPCGVYCVRLRTNSSNSKKTIRDIGVAPDSETSSNCYLGSLIFVTSAVNNKGRGKRTRLYRTKCFLSRLRMLHFLR